MKKSANIPKNIQGRSAIIKEYTQYLRLEKNLSPNTYDAYLTDLEKLLHYLDTANIDPLDVTLENLQHFMAGLHDIEVMAFILLCYIIFLILFHFFYLSKYFN